MGTHNRDWYRDWWRKKTGYTERAAFRMGEGEIKREVHRRAWRRNLFLGFALLAVIFFLALFR